MGRKALLRLLGLLLGLGVLVASLHLPPVRQRVLDLALRQAEAASGFEARAERLDYDLLKLDFRVQGLRLGVPGREPLLRVREARVDLAVSSLVGRPDVRDVQATGLRLSLVRDASGSWNLPASASGSTAGRPTVRLRSLDVRDAEVVVEDRPTAARAHVRALSLRLRDDGGTTRGTLAAGAPAEWRAGAREGRLEITPASLAFDGRDLAVDSLRVKGGEGALEVRGRLRDLASEVAWDLDVRGETDLDTLQPAGPHALRGGVTVSGRVEGPFAAPTAQLSLSGRDVAWGPVEGLMLTARTRLDPKAVSVESATARVAGGTVTLDGQVALDAKGKSRLVAEWQGIGDVVLRAQGLAGTLAGRAEGSWVGPRPAGLALVAELRAHPPEAPSPGSLPLSGRTELRVRDGAWTMEVDHTAGTDLRLSGTVGGRLVESDPLASTLSGDLSLQAESLDVPALQGVIAAGRGRMEATLDGTLAAPRATGSLQGFDVHAPSLAEARVDLTGRFDADPSRVGLPVLEIRAGESRLAAEGSLRLRDRAVDGRFTLASPDVAALGLQLPPGADPAGSLQVEGTLGGTLDRPDLRVDLSGADLRLAGQSFASLTGSVRVEGETVRLDSLELVQAGGRLTLSGEYAPRGVATLRADARGLAVAPIPGALLGRPEPLPFHGVVDLELAASGRADAPEGRGWIAMDRASWEGREIGPLRADLTLHGGRVTADVRAEALHASVGGRLDMAAPNAFDVETRLDGADLAVLAEKAGVRLEGLTGTANGRARIRGELAPRRLSQIEVAEGLVLESGKSRLSVTGALAASDGEPLRINLDADLADASPWLPGPATGRLRASLEATGTPSRPSVVGDLSLEEGTVAVSGRRRSTVTGIAAAATLREGTLTLDLLEATWAGAHIHTSGSATARFLEPWLPLAVQEALGGPPARAALQATLEGDARRWLTPLLGDDTFESRGRDASINAELEAHAPRLDAVQGEIRFSGIDPVLSDVALTQEGTARLVIDAGKARLTDAKWTGSETEIVAAGALDLPAENGLRQAEVDAEIGGKADLRVLQFLGRGVETGGLGSFRLQVRGPLESARPRAEVQFADGFLRYRPARLALDSLHGTLRFGPDGIQAKELRGSLNGGALTVEGEMHQGERVGGEVRLRARGAVLEWPPGFHANLSANLKLAPAGEGLLLSGTANLGGPAYRTSDYFSLQVLNAIEKFSTGPPQPALANLHLDVQVRSSQDVIIQAVDGRLLVGVDLRLGGTASAPALTGRMTAATGGQVFMGGRTYDVDSAVLDFTRGAGLEPWMQVRAQTRVSQYTVLADVTGPATNFRTRFVSDPPLSDRDIVSLLTSGRTISAAGAGAGRTDALSMMSGGMLGRTGRMFGLDSVRIERTGERQDLDFDPTAVSSQANPTSRMTFSKRWGDLQLTYSQSLTSAGNNTWFVSWKPKPPFELRVVQRDDGTGALEFRHDVVFGAGPAPPSRPARRRRGSRSVEKVGEVRVQVDGIDAPERLTELKLRPGKEFDYEKWLGDRDHLTEAMAKEGFFEARILARREPPTRERGQPVSLEYEIRRGPRTSLVFEGMSDSAALRGRAERAWYMSEYGRSVEDEAEALTRAFLFDQGYRQPRVRARTRLSPEGDSKRVTVLVEPGEKSPSHRIVFEGNARVPDERLAALVKGHEKEGWLNREALRQTVLDAYRGEGLLGATVEVGKPRSAGGRLELPVVIDEGPPIALGETKVAGASGLPPEEVRVAAGLRAGPPYKPAEVAAARQRVLDAYHRQGWNGASVRIDGLLDPETMTVSPTLTVAEGERQVLAEVVIEGAPGPRERAEKSLGLRPGEPVVLEEWAEARKRLYDSGFFKSVDIDPQPLSDGGADGVKGIADGDGHEGKEEVRAKVTVQPWPALRLRYGLQLVTEGDLASEAGRSNLQLGGVAEITRRTLWSLPASVGLSIQARQTYQQARGFFTLPRSFGTPLRTSIFLTGTHQTDRLDEAFVGQVDGRVLELTVEERLRTRGKLEVAGSYNAQWSRFDSPVEVLGSEAARFTLARLIGTVLLDGRNDLIDTTRGFFSSASYEFGDEALGSDFPIRKVLLQQYVYVPVGRVVFAAAARFERAAGIGTAFFREDRLLAGGANTVRGYREDSLRPERVNLLGGVSALLVLNQELRFPIVGPVRGVLFGDGAILNTSIAGIRSTDSHWSTGLGLRYVTPVGILRFDFGIPLDQGFQPRRGGFYFSLGQVF